MSLHSSRAVLRERDLLRADVQHLRSTNGALYAENEGLEAEKQHLLIELDKVVNSYADLQYHQFMRDEVNLQTSWCCPLWLACDFQLLLQEEPSRQRAMLELLSVKDKALAEVQRLQQALVCFFLIILSNADFLGRQNQYLSCLFVVGYV